LATPRDDSGKPSGDLKVPYWEKLLYDPCEATESVKVSFQRVPAHVKVKAGEDGGFTQQESTVGT